MRDRLHVFIEGRVQGVGFRYSTSCQASALGLTGWVRNLPDGRVEAVFEGANAQLDAMLEWCHVGPPFASVTRVSASRESATAQWSGFELR